MHPASPFDGVVGILLAAGFARRFVAAAGVSKLLYPLENGVLLGSATATLWRSALDQVISVVPPEKPLLERLLGDAGCEIAVAARAHEGMGASLACGIVAAMERYPAARGWVVGLADMPFLQARTLTQIAAALTDSAAIVAPTYAGRRGHPVGFTAHYGLRLSALGGDEGARHLIASEGAALRLLPVDDPGIHADIDTPDDLIAWQARHPLPESAVV